MLVHSAVRILHSEIHPVPFAGIATPVTEDFAPSGKFPKFAIGFLFVWETAGCPPLANVGTALAIVAASLINMKTSRNIIAVLVAAGAPSVALLALSNLIPTDVAMGVLSVGALLAFAAFDYSRQTKSLRAPGRVVRPVLPAARAVAPVVCTVDRAA